MAKIIYGDALGDYGSPTGFFGGTPKLTNTEGPRNKFTEVDYTDTKTGAHVLFDGKNLHLDKNGILDGGTVSSIEFTTKSGDAVITFTKAHYNAGQLYDAFQEDGIGGLFEAAFSGNDTVIGSKNSDYLFGVGGTDKLLGGRGNDLFYGVGDTAVFTGQGDADYFYIAKGFGKETVTDFDAENDHDVIGVGEGKFKLSYDAKAHEAKIDFGHGDVMIIENLDHKLDPSTFYHFQV